MQHLRGTYVHRGDVERRRRRVRTVFLLAGLVAVADLAVRNIGPRDLGAESITGIRSIRSMHDERRMAGVQIERLNQILGYARRYNISPRLAGSIYDIARADHVDPALALPLVRLESEFKEHATSPVGAIGLTQLMLPTARDYMPNVTREQLYDRDTNLHIGFHYLHDLIEERGGNMELALLTYNRGPQAVLASREMGLDPSNGDERIVLKGYKGRGIVK